MKLYILSVIFLGHIFVAQTSQAESWLMEDNKIIYILNKPSIKVTLNKIAVDEQYYGQLSIISSFDNQEVQKEAEELAKKYPEYKVRFSAIRALEDFKMTINSTGRELMIAPLNSPEGATLNKIIYVNKKEFLQMRSDLQNEPDSFSFSLKAKTIAPILKIVEQRSLGSNICNELFQDGATTYSVMNQLKRVNDRIDSMVIKYLSTKTQLREKVKSSCIELDETLTVSSFEELLNSPLKKKTASKEIMASTKIKVLDDIKFDLSGFNISQEIIE